MVQETATALERRTSFTRWGLRWMIRLVVRKPVVPERLEEAFASLASLDFPLAPVADRHMAVDTAIDRLPSEMRPDEDRSGGCGPYRVHVDSLETGYRVEFQVLDGTTESRVVRSRGYVVARDGTVTEWRP